MKITVTFTDCAGTDLPEGASIAFESVTGYEVSTPADVENITCAVAGCAGCGATHNRFTGTAHLRLEASGSRADGPQWKLPRAAAI